MKKWLLVVMAGVLILAVTGGVMAYQVEEEKPSRFAINQMEVKSAKVQAQDSTVGVLQAVGDAIIDWADWLMVGTKPSGVYDTHTGKGDLGIQFTFWPGEELDGVLGHIPSTGRYYAGIEKTIENLPILGNKIDNIAIGIGGSAEPDFSLPMAVFWVSWNLRA